MGNLKKGHIMEKEKYMIMNGMMCRWWNMTILGMMENLKMANMMVKERCIFDKEIAEYKGAFKNGKYHGKGILYDRKGNVLHKGKFKNGEIA